MKRTSDLTVVDHIPELPIRADDAHKGMVGRVAVIGGRLDAIGMVGAVALVANAALRSGAGLVQIVTSKEAQLAVAPLALCATTRAWPNGEGASLSKTLVEFAADVVAIGPGLGPNVSDDHLRDLLANFGGPIVIDADGLNRIAALRGDPARAFRHPEQVILTPHPGEMSRLVAGWSIDAGDSDRTQLAVAVSRATGAIVVLKGFGTVVTDGQRVFVNQTGNSGMATGGAGDVLTGVIAALCGQHMSPFDAAVLGVYVHGLAGDMAAEEIGRMPMIATDIIDYLPDALSELEEENG